MTAESRPQQVRPGRKKELFEALAHSPNTVALWPDVHDVYTLRAVLWRGKQIDRGEHGPQKHNPQYEPLLEDTIAYLRDPKAQALPSTGVWKTPEELDRLRILLGRREEMIQEEHKPHRFDPKFTRWSSRVVKRCLKDKLTSSADAASTLSQTENGVESDTECVNTLKHLQVVYRAVVARIKQDPRQGLTSLDDPQNMTTYTVYGVTLRTGKNTLVVGIWPGSTEGSDVIHIFYRRKYPFADSTEPELITTAATLNSDGSFNSKTDYKPGDTHTHLVGQYQAHNLNTKTPLTPANRAVAKEIKIACGLYIKSTFQTT